MTTTSRSNGFRTILISTILFGLYVDASKERVTDRDLLTEDGIVERICDAALTRHRDDLLSIDPETTILQEGTVLCISGTAGARDIVAKHIVLKLKSGPITLLTIESDDTIGDSELIDSDVAILKSPVVGAWFAMNLGSLPRERLGTSAQKLRPLPIGLNAWRQGNAMDTFLRANGGRNGIRAIRKKQWMLINFSPNTIERRNLLELARSKRWARWTDVADVGFFDEQPSIKMETNFGALWQRRTSARYYETMSAYRFVVCPRGVGLDTHRIWEALYAGVVPILLRSSFAVNGLFHELVEEGAVLVVDRWEDVTLPLLQLKWADSLNARFACRIGGRETAVDRILRLSYWSSRIRSASSRDGRPLPAPDRERFEHLPRLFSMKATVHQA